MNKSEAAVGWFGRVVAFAPWEDNVNVENDGTTGRRPKLGQGLDLTDLNSLAPLMPFEMRKRVGAAFSTDHGSPVQWLRSEQLLAEHLAKYLCDLVCTAYFIGFDTDAAQAVEPAHPDQRALRHSPLELGLRAMEDTQSTARRRAGKGRGPKGFSFGQYIGVLQTASADKAAKAELNAVLPALVEVLDSPVPTEALRFVKHLSAIKRGRQKYDIPPHRVRAFGYDSCEPLRGKATLYQVFDAIVQTRNKFAHPGEAAPTQRPGAGSDAWWLDDPQFVLYFAERLGQALLALLTWSPIAALLTRYERVATAEPRGSGWAVKRVHQPANLLNAHAQSMLDDPTELLAAPGQEVFAERDPGRPYALTARGLWIPFPRSRWTNALYRERYREAFVASLLDDGQISDPERNRLKELQTELKLSEDLCHDEELAVLGRLSRLLTTAESEAEGGESGDGVEADPSMAGNEALHGLLSAGEWRPADDPASRSARDVAALREALALGAAIQANTREIVRDLRQVTPQMVAETSGLSSELASWALNHLARSNRDVRVLDKAGGTREKRRRFRRFVYVDMPLVEELSKVLEAATDTMGQNEPISAKLLVRACRVAHAAVVAALPPQESAGRHTTTLSLLEQLAAGREAGADTDGASLRLTVDGKALQAPYLKLLLEQVGSVLGAKGIAALPEQVLLTPAQALLATSPKHPNGAEFRLPVTWSAGQHKRYLEGSLGSDVLAFHLTRLLTTQGHTLEEWQGDDRIRDEVVALARKEFAAELDFELPADRGLYRPADPRDRGVRVVRRGRPGEPTPSPIDIVGRTVPEFLYCFLSVAHAEGWIEQAMLRGASGDDGETGSLPPSMELPVPLSHVRVALSHTPCRLDSQPMKRPVSAGGLYMEASVQWLEAIEVVVDLLRSPERLDVTAGDGAPATRIQVVEPATATRYRVPIPGRRRALKVRASDGPLLPAVLRFIDGDASFQLPELPFVVDGRAVVAPVAQHPGGRPFWQPVEVELASGSVWVDRQVNERDAQFQARALLRAARLEPDVEDGGPARAVRVWALAPGRGAELWEQWREQGISSLGWAEVHDLSTYLDKGEVERELMARSDSDSRQFNSANALFDFGHIMEPGDIVVAKAGVNRIVGWGRVASEYRFAPDEHGAMPHVRQIDWTESEASLETRLPLKTLTDITSRVEMLRYLAAVVPPIAELFRSGVVSDADSSVPLVEDDDGGERQNEDSGPDGTDVDSGEGVVELAADNIDNEEEG